MTFLNGRKTKKNGKKKNNNNRILPGFKLVFFCS